MLTKKFKALARTLLGINPNTHAFSVPARYGSVTGVFGKWKTTTKGIFFKRSQFGECDYFLDNRHLTEIIFIKSELDRLLKSNWLDEIDCYHLLSAWTYQISSQENCLVKIAELLSLLQQHVREKFAMLYT